MNVRLALKAAAERVPRPLASVVSRVPFEWRLGAQYRTSRREITTYETLRDEGRRAFILSRMQQIVSLAYVSTEFYKEFYEDNAFHPSQLKTFDDIQSIPIVTKTDLSTYHINKRSKIEIHYSKGLRRP